jgi:hypothetical protein
MPPRLFTASCLAAIAISVNTILTSSCFAFTPSIRHHVVVCDVVAKAAAVTAKQMYCSQSPLYSVKPTSSDNAERISVFEYEHKYHRFNRDIFAKSNCWGRRPFLMRGAFDPNLLMGTTSANEDSAWPSWDDVVNIAADDDSESRCVL